MGFNKFKGKTRFVNKLNNQQIEFTNGDIDHTFISYTHESQHVYNPVFLENIIAKQLGSPLVIYDKVD